MPRQRIRYDAALCIEWLPNRPEHNRLDEGDIVAIKSVRGERLQHARHGEVGRKEASEFLWLRLASAELWLQEMDLAETMINEEKRRYCIPLARLQQHVPTLDLARVRDPTDPYQPLMNGLDRDQDYEVWTIASAQAAGHDVSALAAEVTMQRFRPRLQQARADAVMYRAMMRTAPSAATARSLASAEARIDKYDHPSRLDTAKVAHREIYRLPDGSWTLTMDGQGNTSRHFFGPPMVLDVEGLVFDKRTGRYL